MSTEDLEDLLKTKKYSKWDTKPLQEIVSEIVVDLRSTGRKMVIASIFTDNTVWLHKSVKVLDQKDNEKEIVVKHKPLSSEYQIEVEYFDPAEVAAF